MGQAGQRAEIGVGVVRQGRQACRRRARLEHRRALLDQLAELAEHARQLLDRAGQLLVAQEEIAGQPAQADVAQLATHGLELVALLGSDFLQGQHLVHVELLGQARDQPLGTALQYQQGGAALAQLAVQRRQALQLQARAVHAEAATAEGAGLQQGRVEDVDRQQAVGLQGGLQGRMVVEAQILFDPQQYAAHGLILKGAWAPSRLRRNANRP